MEHIEERKESVRRYSRWFWLGLWAGVINGILMFAMLGAGFLVYGTSFLLFGSTRLAIGISVLITVAFFVLSFIAQGWGEDWSQRRVGPPV